jgi:hypothetical protein
LHHGVDGYAREEEIVVLIVGRVVDEYVSIIAAALIKGDVSFM